MPSKWGYWDDYRLALEKSPIDLSALDGRRIFLTGATGLIGTALVDLFMFLKSECAVDLSLAAGVRDIEAAESVFAEYKGKDGLSFIQYEMTQPIDVNAVGQCDFIIHAASIANPVWYVERPFDTAWFNVKAVEHILDLVRATDSTLLYVSSVEVYGAVSSDRLVSETDFGGIDPLINRNSYPEAKRFSETLCVNFGAQHGTRVFISRPSKVYGPSNSPSDTRLMAHILRQAVAGKDLAIRSAGEEAFAFSYVTDAALAHLYILLRGEPGAAYNIADQASVDSIRNVVARQARVAQVDASFGESSGTATSKGLMINTEKLEGLGWAAQTDLDSGAEKQFIAAKREVSSGK